MKPHQNKYDKTHKQKENNTFVPQEKFLINVDYFVILECSRENTRN